MNILKENERIDDLQVAGLKIIQNKNLFCFGTDAVLLHHFVEPKNLKKVVDFGTGTGILSVLLGGKNKNIEVFALEIQPALFEMATRSVKMNNLSNVHIINGDLKDAYKLVGRCDAVMCNPPYEKCGSALSSENNSHKIAREEICCNFDDIAKSAGQVLGDGGSFYFIHRAPRFTEITQTLKKYNLMPKKVRFIHGKKNTEAKYFLCCAKKGGREYLTVMPPLIVHKDNGEYEDETARLYFGEK